MIKIFATASFIAILGSTSMAATITTQPIDRELPSTQNGLITACMVLSGIATVATGGAAAPLIVLLPVACYAWDEAGRPERE